MKKLIFVFFLFFFASSAGATIYKWVDEKGVLNFVDHIDKVPPVYRDSVEEVKSPKMPTQRALTGKTSTKGPPISQNLIREGDFAVKLAGVLKVVRAQSEAEAESMLTSAGIAPRNGWIADYPVTPDIIGELENTVAEAADAGKLAMKKSEATKAFGDLLLQQNLPVRADTESRYAATGEPSAEASPPQDYPEYYEPVAINNYYSDQGPPIVTYYPPPPDYGYLYSWVSYPFWCTGFWFPGFFVLRDFHRVVSFDRHPRLISNHFWDSRRRGFGTIDPARRHMGNVMANISHPARGFASHDAGNGASSILRRSADHTALNRPGGVSGSKGGPSGRSSFRGGLTGVRPLAGYRAPSRGPSISPRVPFSRPTYGSSFSHGGSFSHPGAGVRRSSSPPSGSRSPGFQTGGSGSRGFSGGGGRGYGGGVRGRT